MKFSLKGKAAVITGGGSGIGKAICETFAEHGAHIHILDLDQENGQATATALKNKGHQAEFHLCDVTNKKQTQEIIEGIGEKGGLDILVNNAGVAHVGNIENTSEQDMDRLYQVNVKGVFNCTQPSIKYMKKTGGVILNLASIASSVAVADRFAYSMTKGAVLTMTYSIAKDYIDYKIRCNCISPGRVHTPFVDNFIAKNYPGKEEQMFDTLSKTQPLGRMGKPSEIADLALFLCSDEASFVTGSNYAIDGGFVTLNG